METFSMSNNLTFPLLCVFAMICVCVRYSYVFWAVLIVYGGRYIPQRIEIRGTFV